MWDWLPLPVDVGCKNRNGVPGFSIRRNRKIGPFLKPIQRSSISGNAIKFDGSLLIVMGCFDTDCTSGLAGWRPLLLHLDGELFPSCSQRANAGSAEAKALKSQPELIAARYREPPACYDGGRCGSRNPSSGSLDRQPSRTCAPDRRQPDSSGRLRISSKALSRLKVLVQVESRD